MRRRGFSLKALLCSLMWGNSAWAVDVAGRIDFALTGGSCSGILVAPDLVATAAHCTPTADADFPGVSFVSGAGDGPVAVVAGVVHPLYDPESVRLEWQLRFDLGLVLLDTNASRDSDAILPVGREAEAGETLFLVSWRASDGPRPRQRACPVLSVGIEGLVTLGCEVAGGESGAPVLRKTERGLELVAIVSSRARLLAQPVAQASNVRLRLPPLFDLADKLRGP